MPAIAQSRDWACMQSWACTCQFFVLLRFIVQTLKCVLARVPLHAQKSPTAHSLMCHENNAIPSAPIQALEQARESRSLSSSSILCRMGILPSNSVLCESRITDYLDNQWVAQAQFSKDADIFLASVWQINSKQTISWVVWKEEKKS